MPSQLTCDGGGKSLDLQLSRNRTALAVQCRLIALVLGVFAFAAGAHFGLTHSPHLDEARTLFKEAAKTVSSIPQATRVHTILSNRSAFVRIFKEGV